MYLIPDDVAEELSKVVTQLMTMPMGGFTMCRFCTKKYEVHEPTCKGHYYLNALKGKDVKAPDVSVEPTKKDEDKAPGFISEQSPTK